MYPLNLMVPTLLLSFSLVSQVLIMPYAIIVVDSTTCHQKDMIFGVKREGESSVSTLSREKSTGLFS